MQETIDRLRDKADKLLHEAADARAEGDSGVADRLSSMASGAFLMLGYLIQELQEVH